MSKLTLEKHLFNLVNEDENLKSLRTSYDSMRSKMELYLPAIIAIFPHYSSHDTSHTKNIISVIERILGTKRIEQLTAADTWLILMSAYMHDIGMLASYEEDERTWESSDFQRFLSDCEIGNDLDFINAAKMVRGFHQGLHEYKAWPLKVKQSITLLIAEYYRRRHAERSNNIADGKSPISGLLRLVLDGGPVRAMPLVGQISLMHGSDFNTIIESLPEYDSLFNDSMHPRLAAVLLRLGDLCDVDNGRFNIIGNSMFGELPEKSLVHYFKHETIKRLYVSERVIAMDADVNFNDIKIKLDLRKQKYSDTQKEDFCHKVVNEHQRWFDMLTQELQNINLFINYIFPDYLDSGMPTFEYNLMIDGEKSMYSRENLRFNFSRTKAFDLIEGYSLYDEPRTFVRELIQNSLDALKLQMWNDIQSGMWDHLIDEENYKNKTNLSPLDFVDNSIYNKYFVNINISFDEENKNIAELTFTDNGIGIGFKDIQSKIIQTGISWLERNDNNLVMDEIPKWLHPTGSFGIGLHSIFAVTDIFEIKTQTRYEKYSNHIILHSGKKDGYVFARTSKDKRVALGTNVVLRIDTEKLRLKPSYSIEPYEKQFKNSFTESIINYIKTSIICPLFEVRFNGSTIVQKLCDSDIYSSIFNKDKPLWLNEFSSENFDFAIQNERPLSFVMFDRNNYIIYNLGVNSRKDKAIASYMGINLTNENFTLSSRFISLYAIEFLTGAGKDIVTADRKHMKTDYKETILIEFDKIPKEIVDFSICIFTKTMNNPLVIRLFEETKQLAGNLSSKEKLNIENLCLQTLKMVFPKPVLADSLFFTALLFRSYLSLNRKKIYDDILKFSNEMNSDESLSQKSFATYIKKFTEIESIRELLEVSQCINKFWHQFGNNYNSKIGHKFGIGYDRESDGSTLDIILGNIFGVEFVCAFDGIFNNMFERASKFMYGHAMFGNGFNDIFDDEFFCSFGQGFGHSSHFEWGNSFLERFRIKIFELLYLEKGKKFENELTLESEESSFINLLFNDNWVWVLWLAHCTGKIKHYFTSDIKEYLNCLPGYWESYGFENCKNIEDIVTSSELSIKIKNLSKSTFTKLPSLHYMGCAMMEKREDGLYVTFSFIECSEPVLIVADMSSINDFFCIEDENVIPCFDRYRSLGIQQNKYAKLSFFPQNLAIILPKNIDEQSLRTFILNGQDSEYIKIAIRESEQVKNIIEYTYFHRIDPKISFEEIKGNYSLLISDYVEAIR